MSDGSASGSHDAAQDSRDNNQRTTEKRARTFDLQAIFEETRKAAQEHRAEATAKEALRAAEEGREAEERAAAATSAATPEGQTSRPADKTARQASAASLVSSGVGTSEEDDEDDMMPALPPGFRPDPTVFGSAEDAKRDDGDNDGDDDVEDEEDEYLDLTKPIPVVQLIPASSEVEMRHGKKPVSCLTWDFHGQRLAVGGLDYNVSIFEFERMDMRMLADKVLTPCESYVINALAYSANGEKLVIANGSPLTKVLDRQGKQWAETIRGDQYIHDVGRTNGHTAAVNGVCWNPMNKEEFLTCGDDGTLRLMSTTDFKELTKVINVCRKVIRTKTVGGIRSMPQCCAFSPDGKLIGAGCDDGTIFVWKYGSLYVNPQWLMRKAHAGPVTSLAFSYDSRRLLTRGLDDSLKMWSLEDKTKPLLVRSDLPNYTTQTECGWSPSGEIVFTGTAMVKGDEEGRRPAQPGQLVFCDAATLETVYQISYPGASCIACAWHPRLNQVAAGLSDGTVHVYYDMERSRGGVMLCAGKKLRRTQTNEVVREEFVIAPLTMEMFQPRGEDKEERELTDRMVRRLLRQHNNKLRPEFRKPAMRPVTGPGVHRSDTGGTLHSFVAKQIGVEQNREFIKDTDVRASILRHAKDAEENPMYINKAYRKTQPVPIFAEKTTAPEEESTNDDLEPVYKKTRIT